MNTQKNSFMASSNTETGSVFFTSPHIQKAVNLALTESGASQCKVAVYDVLASLIDPDNFDSLFEFEYVGLASDEKSLMEQYQKAQDAYELKELRKFKLETLRAKSLDQEHLDEVTRLENLISKG